MKQKAILVVKFATVWLAVIIGQMAGGMIGQMVSHAEVPVFKPDGPFGFMAALIIVAGLHAAVMAALAAHMRWGFWAKAASLFILFYALDSALSQIEAIYFNSYLHLSDALLLTMAIGNAIKAALVAIVCTALWREQTIPAERLSGVVWKLPLIIPLYIACYFGAGFLIAWRSPELRAYYAQGFHIDNAQLALLQVGRGLIWALLTLLSVASLTGSKAFRAALTGVAFAVLMAVTLLFPNSFMPWSVRHMHLIELLVSNLLFGVVASLILLSGPKASPQT